jgi:hypothetical protein
MCLCVYVSVCVCMCLYLTVCDRMLLWRCVGVCGGVWGCMGVYGSVLSFLDVFGFRIRGFGNHILTQNGFPSGPMTPITRGLITYPSPDAFRILPNGLHLIWCVWESYKKSFVVLLGTNLVSKFQNSDTTF